MTPQDSPGGSPVTAGTSISCAHGGAAVDTVKSTRVLIDGSPAVLVGSPFLIADCPLPPAVGGPCLIGQFLAGTTRVSSEGRALALSGGPSTCTPTGTPLIVAGAQDRVAAV